MKKNIKKIISVIAATLTIGSTLVGCGGASSPDKSSGKETTITYAIWDKDQEPGMRKAADAFEQKNPDIKVKIEVTPWDQYWTKLEASGSGGSLPDVFWMHANEANKYMNASLLMDLTDNIKKSSLVNLKNFPQDLVGLYEKDSKNYAIPRDFDTVGLWYNKTLFDQAGIKYPDSTWTWDTLLDAAKKLTNKEKGIYGLAAPLDGQQGIYNYVFQNGGKIVSDDKTKSEYNTPATKEALEWYVNLSLKEGVSPTQKQFVENDTTLLFESGKVAMGLFGSWMINAFSSNEYTSKNCDVAVLPMGKERATVYNGLGNAISAKAKNPDAAWKFVEFLGSEEASKIQAQSGSAIPAYKGVADEWVKTSNKFNLKAFVEMLDYAKIHPYINNNSKFVATQNDILKKVFAGELKASDACDQLSKEIDRIIKE